MHLPTPHYKLFTPGLSYSGFANELNNCFENLRAYLSDGKYRVFRLNIFINSEDYTDYGLKKNLISKSIKELFNGNCPPNAIISQPPENPFSLIIEAGFYTAKDVNIQYYNYNSIKFRCKISCCSSWKQIQ